MRSFVGKLGLRKKKDPPSQGPPIICELPIPEQVGQTHAPGSSFQEESADSEHRQQKKMAHPQNSHLVSRLFSQTQTISRDKNTRNGHVEVSSTRNYKTQGSNQLDSNDWPYGIDKLPTFGPQWGMASSKGTEQTESCYGNAQISIFESQYIGKASKGAEYTENTYGKADVSFYGPQFGIPALSPDDDLYGDSDEEGRMHRSIKKLTTVKVVKVSPEVNAKEAVMSLPLDNAIPPSYQWVYDAISEKHDIVYRNSTKETKPKAMADATLPAELYPPVTKTLEWEVDQSIAESSWPFPVSKSSDNTNHYSPRTVEMVNKQPNPFVDSAGAESSWDPYGSFGDDMDTDFVPEIGPRSCIICTDDFSAWLKPPSWITISCAHEPSVCCGCMAKCIKTDLESKIWNQIKCPECKTLLVYEDIQRLADPETFAKYEALSFRNAIGKDENFVWCQNCDFGQLHNGGNEQPIVRCMKCGFRSCFRHNVPWHDCLTCQEYDEMMDDPDGFRSAIEKDDEAAALALRQQHEADERMARDLEAQDREEEEDRQRAMHEEELRIAREAQRAEAERKRLEKEELEKAKKREEIKRRKQQEELSLKTVRSTTKNCPGCRWPIEKNHGCSHMTCIRCCSEFCWSCLNDYKAIRKLGNSEHKPTCKFHTDNLPDLDDGEVDPGEDSD